MGKVGGDTWSVDDIVESKLVDKRASLHEEGKRLANATGSTCDDCDMESVTVVLECDRGELSPHLPTFMLMEVFVIVGEVRGCQSSLESGESRERVEKVLKVRSNK